MVTLTGTFESTNPALEAARRRLAAESCALVVVDIQEKLLPPIHERERLVSNVQMLLRLAGILELPVLVTTQYARGLGPTVEEISSLLPSDAEPVDKVEFSCFGSERFCDAVERLPGRRDAVIICGMETHICVMQTALGALNRGLAVHVPADAVGSRSLFNWQIGLDRMKAAGAVITSTETAVYELMRASGTAVFKQMLPYLKS